MTLGNQWITRRVSDLAETHRNLENELRGMNPLCDRYQTSVTEDPKQEQEVIEEVQNNLGGQVERDTRGIDIATKSDDKYLQSEERRLQRRQSQRDRTRVTGLLFQLIKSKTGLPSNATRLQTLRHVIGLITYYQETIRQQLEKPDRSRVQLETAEQAIQEHPA